MDKLTAIKIKKPDGSYSTPIAISALAQNILYGDGVYNVKDILDSLDARIDNITAVGTDGQLTAIRVGADNETYATARAAIVANDIKNRELVLVKDTQPTEIWNKLWLDTSDADEQRIISTDDMANIIAAYYDEEADYAIGDYVIHEDANTNVGKLYKCKTAISGGETWTAAHWNEISVTEDYNEVIQNVNDQIDDVKSALSDWLRLDGVIVPDGYDLTPLAVESGIGQSYYVNNDTITPTGMNGFNYYKIPIVAGETYKSNSPARWIIFVDDSNVIKSYDNVGSSTYNAPTGATYMILSYADDLDFAVGRNFAPASHNIIYLLPDDVKATMSFSDLNGKLKSNMVDGYIRGNLAFDITLLYENKYCYANSANSNPLYDSNSSYNVYRIEISNKSYTFKQARFCLPVKPNGKSVSASIGYATSYDNTAGDAKYLYLSLDKNVSPIETYVISEGSELKVNDTYPNWTGANKIISDLSPKELKKVQTGSLSSSGEYIICPIFQEARKGFRLVFDCVVTSGTDFDIGFSTAKNNITSNPHNVFNITNTNVTWNNISHTHGLALEGHVQFVLEVSEIGTPKITIISNGNVYSTTGADSSFNFSAQSVPYVTSKGIVATNCKLLYTNTDFLKKIWMIGDSYTAYSIDRWPYYAHQDGYLKNIFLDGFSGMESTQAKKTFPDIVKLSKPQYAVWLMGMNDGSDTNDTTPSSSWVNGKNVFLETCLTENIIPVFATIPNVPTINHKGKNAWIRSSGYRYIDFSHAVGADDNVNWYTGMLSNDGIHPTRLGAVALYGQILIDFPEIMID